MVFLEQMLLNNFSFLKNIQSYWNITNIVLVHDQLHWFKCVLFHIFNCCMRLHLVQ